MTDSSADMMAIVERLERLEKVLVRLCEAVEARPGAVMASPTVQASQKPPPVVAKPAVSPPVAPAKVIRPPVATPAAVAPKKAAAATPKPPELGTANRPASIAVELPSARPKSPVGPPPDVEPLLNEEQARALLAKELELAPYLPATDSDPSVIIRTLFEFALQASDIGNPLMLALFHSDVISAPRSPEHLKAFNFPKLRRNIQLYLTDADPSSYVLVRSEIDDAQLSVKVFLHRLGGMPAPVRLKRDPEAGDAWRIVQMSL